MKLTIGTRTSALAMWQTHHVIALLQEQWPELVCEIRPFVTKGDKTQASGQPLPEIGGKGLFTAELEASLRAKEIDIAVHSLKDLPTQNPDNIILGAIASRADVRDALVSNGNKTLSELPHGAVVGTSSLRRQAQLLAQRPDLTVKSIRGNVGTRLKKVRGGLYDAAVLATAGLERLEMGHEISEKLSPDVMLPAPGQGALGIQCRADDDETKRFLTAINDETVRGAVTAERVFLATLQGGCSAPIGAYAQATDNGWKMTAVIASTDGAQQIHVTGHAEDATELGKQLAAQALDRGARELLP